MTSDAGPVRVNQSTEQVCQCPEVCAGGVPGGTGAFSRADLSGAAGECSARIAWAKNLKENSPEEPLDEFLTFRLLEEVVRLSPGCRQRDNTT